MRRFWFTAVALVWAASWTSVALAAPTETGETGLVTLPTTEVLAPWKFGAGVYENGTIDPTHGVKLYRTEFSLGIGLLDNLELTAQIPYVQFTRDTAVDRHTDDIGGLRVGAKYRLLNEDDGAPLSAALLAAVVIGTGRDSFPALLDRNQTIGNRELYEVMAILDKRLFTLKNGAPTIATLNAGGLLYDRPHSFVLSNQSFQVQRRFRGPNANFDDVFEFGAGLNVGVLKRRRVQLSLLEEFRGNTGTINEVMGSLPTYVFTGARLQLWNGLAVQGGVDFGMSGFLDPHRFVAGLTYAMPAAPLPPEPVAPAAPPPPQPPTPPRQKIILRGVHFDFDKATLRPDSMPVLRQAAATLMLKENSDVLVVVEGHTDGRGTDEYNLKLSLHRAQAVRDELVNLGVDPTRLSVRGKGKSEPVASNDTDEGRAQNRRVELLVP